MPAQIKDGITAKLNGKRILIVDTDEFIRDSLSYYFEALGCAVAALKEAAEGIKALAEQKFMILITNQNNGKDVCTLLKEKMRLQRECIALLITPRISEVLLQKADALGVSGFISNPLSARHIEESLSRLIDS